jgi:hypothetical protein
VLAYSTVGLTKQYLTPNDRRTRGKNRLNYQERSSTDNYGQSKKKKKKKKTSSDMESK